MNMKVSPSRLGSISFCPKNHHYSYVLNLKPKKASDAMDVGTLVHKGIEEFYRTGEYVPVDSELGEIGRKVNAAMFAYRLLSRMDDRFTVVDLEKEFELEVPELDVLLNGYIDGVVRLDGQLWLLEHKTVGQHWPEEGLALAPQHVLYEIAAEAIYGEPVAGTFYNFIRLTTRGGEPHADARRMTVLADPNVRVSVWDDMVQKVGLIRSGYNARNPGKHCKWCSMFSLCRTEYLGGDTEEVIAAFYEERKRDDELPDSD